MSCCAIATAASGSTMPGLAWTADGTPHRRRLCQHRRNPPADRHPRPRAAPSAPVPSTFRTGGTCSPSSPSPRLGQPAPRERRASTAPSSSDLHARLGPDDRTRIRLRRRQHRGPPAISASSSWSLAVAFFIVMPIGLLLDHRRPQRRLPCLLVGALFLYALPRRPSAGMRPRTYPPERIARRPSAVTG